MSGYFKTFSKILDHSIKKHNNADKPLTVGHLNNIVKLAIKMSDGNDARDQAAVEKALDEIWNDQHKYGKD